jgi:hypothetical protein
MAGFFFGPLCGHDSGCRMRHTASTLPRDQDPAKAAPNHRPNFFVDEKALMVGVHALATVTLSFLTAAKTD